MGELAIGCEGQSSCPNLDTWSNPQPTSHLIGSKLPFYSFYFIDMVQEREAVHSRIGRQAGRRPAMGKMPSYSHTDWLS